MNAYLPEVAWRTIANNVQITTPDYHYVVTVSPVNINEPGASTAEVAIGDWFIDFIGYVFEVTDVTGSVITVYDINERKKGSSFIGPYSGKEAYVYRPQNGAFGLSQAQLRYLDRSAQDVVQPIEKGIIWGYRGLQIEGEFGGVTPETVDNITALEYTDYFTFSTETDGWQGGKKYTLTLDPSKLVGGLDTQLQYNNGGVFGGAAITYNNATQAVTVEGAALFESTLGFTLGTTINEISTDGTLTGNSDDAVPTEKAVKTYVDNAVVGYEWIVTTVVAATTGNITIATALNNGDVLDGVTLATGEYVLVKNQTTKAQNGLYVVGVTPARAPEMDAAGEFKNKAILVTGGTINGGSSWVCISTVTTVDTDDVEFAKLSQSVSYTAGSGIDITGQTISVDPAGSDTEVQFNNGDVLGSSTLFKFEKTVGVLTVRGVNQGHVDIERNSTANTDSLVGRLRYKNRHGLELAKIDSRTVGSDSATTQGGIIALFTKAESGLLTERMRILSDGKTGINTTTPAYTLDINGDAGFTNINLYALNPKIRIKDNTNDYYWDIEITADDAYLKFSKNGTTHVTFWDLGRVGVGVASPAYTLDINGDVNVASGSMYKIDGTDLSTSNIVEGTRLYYTDDRARAAISLTTTGTSGASTYSSATGVLNIPQYQAALTNPITGTGTANQIAYFTGVTSLASLSTATYPSLTELSRVKGVTSAIQTQLNGKQATLVSGTNIKTVNSTTLLGSGNLAVENVLTFAKSLSRVTNTVELVNDSTSPGNSKYYGTNSSGTKGFHDIPVTLDPYRDISATSPTLAAGLGLNAILSMSANTTLTLSGLASGMSGDIVITVTGTFSRTLTIGSVLGPSARTLTKRYLGNFVSNAITLMPGTYHLCFTVVVISTTTEYIDFNIGKYAT